MRYVGWSEFWHDAGIAAITEEGNIEWAVHGERYSEKKFDSRLPIALFDWIRDDDNVTYYEDPWIRQHSHRRTKGHMDRVKDHISGANKGDGDTSMIWTSLDYDQCIPHHHSHAGMAYYTRPWESSEDTVIVTIDGQGEADTMNILNHKFETLHRFVVPKSIGLIYTDFTQALGYRSMEEEYVVMGLSAYGEPTFADELIRYFGKLSDHDKGPNPELASWDRWLQEKALAAWIRRKMENVCPDLNDFKKTANVAASVQKFAEHHILEVMKLARKHGSKVCYGGGVAQNVVANSLFKSMFDEVWIAPSPTDAGSALGCAARTWAQATGKDRINWTNSFLGYDIKKDINPREVVDHLVEHTYCGVANGRAEFGPRALGNRSLIADPRFDVKGTVNRIKRRQQFRPFAPAIMEEFVDEYFDGPTNEYMQYQSKALHDYKAVTHVDGTARVQVVRKDHGSILRPILEEFYDRTGVPMLLNTSLNIRGKPMVNDERHADLWEKTYGVKVF